MEFSTSKIIEILDINRNTFQDWMDRRLITPEIQKSSKQGQSNIFSLDDLYRIRLFQLLMEFGLRRSEASEQSRISFENVGKGRDKVKYRLFMASKDDPELGLTGDGKNWEKPPKIRFDENEVLALVVNLLAIKEEVDNLIKEQ